ncbi:hypothetical protein AB1286_04575 [Trinickia sp. NRRL B-1857]|uniref:hypothetical protein n=1 Tax=Trinickia sp. NRRL B-1857 TaxID=3162879 RepID=UPI003D276D03
MIPLATTPTGRQLVSAPVARPVSEASRHIGPHEPSSTQWAYNVALACAKATVPPIPFRQGGIAVGTTYRTTLAIPDLGYVGMTVTHESSHLVIRLSCTSNTSYAWLTMRKHRLESSLTHVFGRATHVELDHDAKR